MLFILLSVVIPPVKFSFLAIRRRMQSSKLPKKFSFSTNKSQCFSQAFTFSKFCQDSYTIEETVKYQETVCFRSLINWGMSFGDSRGRFPFVRTSCGCL